MTNHILSCNQRELAAMFNTLLSVLTCAEVDCSILGTLAAFDMEFWKTEKRYRAHNYSFLDVLADPVVWALGKFLVACICPVSEQITKDAFVNVLIFIYSIKNNNSSLSDIISEFATT